MAHAADTAPILPNPVFEGSEKRVEIDFVLSHASPLAGLRALSRSQLDELMGLAACTIVSHRTNDQLDAYVLSESSLFVYPTKWVLKTCGTTKLLNAVPRLLEMAAALNMEPRRCKYSRASFLFPERQPFPHTSFEHEAFFLRQHFGHLGHGGSAYVLGDMFHGLQWHVYVVDALGAVYEDVVSPHPHLCPIKPTHKLEVCMTDLGKAAAQRFFRDEGFVSAAHTTTTSGIRALIPGADIDDYVFEPCGYSMNGILRGGFITIHITPEEGFSYASVEISGFDPNEYDPADMVARIVAIFQPGTVSVSLSVDVASRSGGYTWGTLPAPPQAYGCQGATCQELATGGRVSYYTLTRLEAPAAAPSPGAPPRSKSPVLAHMPSFSSLPTDTDFEFSSGASSGDEGEATNRMLGRLASAERSPTPPNAAAAAKAAAWGQVLGAGAVPAGGLLVGSMPACVL